MHALHEDDTLIIHENPFDSDHFDVIWKRRERATKKDYRSRQKTTVDNKLKPYDGTVENEKKLEDKSIDYSYIDEYCKVSGPVKTRDEDSRPRQLKTNTTEFGRSKVPFDKFERHHIGGSGPERTEYSVRTQPLANSSSRCQRVQCGTTGRGAQDSHETTMLGNSYNHQDIALACCGHNVETLADYCTCMFCVKGIFYHCSDDSPCSDDLLDSPCQCSPVNTTCVTRWCMLSLLSVFLPCLFCYPIARGCMGVCKCYKEGENRRKNRQNRTVQNTEHQRLT